MNTWVGDEIFLNKRAAIWCFPNGTSSPVKWKFTSYANVIMPFYIYSCELESMGKTVVGSGSDDSPESAARKAFAEAWERLWMLLYNDSGVLTVDLGESEKIPVSSNGFAAGATNEQAIQNSRNELIERAIFLRAWQSMEGWRPVRFKNLKNKVISFGLRLGGWNTHLFDIKSNAGNVKACLLINPKRGAAFDVALFKKYEGAESSLLRSVVRTTFAMRHTSTIAELPLKGRPEDHAAFYSNPENLKAFDFLLRSTNNTKIKSCEDGSDGDKFKSIELPELGSIQTEQIVPAGTFPAVARSQNDRWEPLTWGKLSIKGNNPWPHPLA